MRAARCTLIGSHQGGGFGLNHLRDASKSGCSGYLRIRAVRGHTRANSGRWEGNPANGWPLTYQHSILSTCINIRIFVSIFEY
eukprot:5881808-Prymnesium_polylepis.1